MVCVKHLVIEIAQLSIFSSRLDSTTFKLSPALFAYNEGGKRQKKSDEKSKLPFDILLVVYVDDIIFSGHSKPVSSFKKAISKRFQIKSKDSTEEYTGFNFVYRKKIGAYQPISTHRQSGGTIWIDRNSEGFYFP